MRRARAGEATALNSLARRGLRRVGRLGRAAATVGERAGARGRPHASSGLVGVRAEASPDELRLAGGVPIGGMRLVRAGQDAAVPAAASDAPAANSHRPARAPEGRMDLPLQRRRRELQPLAVAGASTSFQQLPRRCAGVIDILQSVDFSVSCGLVLEGRFAAASSLPLTMASLKMIEPIERLPFIRGLGWRGLGADGPEEHALPAWTKDVDGSRSGSRTISPPQRKYCGTAATSGEDRRRPGRRTRSAKSSALFLHHAATTVSKMCPEADAMRRSSSCWHTMKRGSFLSVSHGCSRRAVELKFCV